jgi:hypothetical protein
MELMKDPTEEIDRRIREIQRAQDSIPRHLTDEKELKEREEAAKAYAGENEKHFVDYLQDCINQSVTASRDIRRTQAHCYRVYKENEPVNYARKEPWQSRIVVPKPFATVNYGSAAVKKAFTPKYLSVADSRNQGVGEFWKKTMETQLDEQHAKFPLKFMDATTMALAIGLSMEMIPRWVPGRGLEYVLVEPWKIHRDPDALSRDHQSGMYWIHQEWLDHFVLQEGEKRGKYFKVGRAKEMENEDPQNDFMTKEAIAARKNMVWERSNYRTMVLTSEFWGIVLDPKGNLLLPRATYTVAGGRVIELPKNIGMQSIRWPGIAFSPVPDLLKFGGRGLLEGVMTVWEAMCNLMCLHEDNMKWIVNPMTEINTDALVDPRDVETYPGKEYLTKETVSGQQAVRTVNRRGVTNEVLGNMQYLDQSFQRGSMVNDAVQGLPGYRKDITWRESEMLLGQALGVFSLMGENLEGGATDSIMAGAEIVRCYATYDDYRRMFEERQLQELGIVPNPQAPTGVSGVPDVDGLFHVSGIQTLMKENEALLNIQKIVIPLSGSPAFAPYIKPYKILKAIEVRTNLKDEGVIVDENKAGLIEAQQYEQLAEQAKAEADKRDLEHAERIAGIAEKMERTKQTGGTAA